MTAVELWAAAACYSAVVFFALASAVKLRKYSNVPLGLRWELYPVPSEAQREHGGSFLEESAWWEKPPSFSRLAELKELFAEMLFIKRLYRSKREVWYFSFLFHGGVYLILGWFVLILAGGVTQLLFYPVSLAAWSAYPALWSQLLFYITIGFGYAGVSAGSIGAVGLLVERYRDRETRDLSEPADYFNLVFALALLVSGAGALTADPTFNVARSMATFLVSGAGAFVALPATYSRTLSTLVAPQTVLQLGLLLSFVVYLPFTRLLHFFGKYFTYHRVLWDSAPSMFGGAFNKRLGEKVGRNLALGVPWSASHVSGGADWREVVKPDKD